MNASESEVAIKGLNLVTDATSGSSSINEASSMSESCSSVVKPDAALCNAESCDAPSNTDDKASDANNSMPPTSLDSSSATASHGPSTNVESCSSAGKKQPLCVLVLGMAGSGKTSVVRRLSTYLASARKLFYTINLDPAVKNVPFMPYIDIRDTVDYKEVMKQYSLGPNGGIVTSLNLFSTMFDDVLKLIAKKEDHAEYIIFDTPGQIEVFNWSASGPIIAGALASVYPTVIVYVVDTVRSNNTQTFMANMLYACSILYKYKLPFVIAFNKIDITDCKFAFEWMQDFEVFQDVVAEESSFSSNLTRSLSLVLEEFYCNIKACGVSSFTGEGMPQLVEKLAEGVVEYEEYRAEYEQLKADACKKKEEQKKQNMAKFQADLGADGEKELIDELRSTINKDTEVLVNNYQSESDSDEDGELDCDDMEEAQEHESFQKFLKNQKDKLEEKMAQKIEEQRQEKC
ncbi:GPN-loop GTPase [Trinorchestia longiramus]|nr:GPN-loop GTPase [Trinorchestia longiramus]